MTVGSSDVRRLVRARDGKVIAGVAAGLGEYFHIDPLWFRLGFVLSVFAGGIGLIAYGVLWVLMPKDATATPTSLQRRADAFAGSFSGTPTWIGFALIVVGALVFLSSVTHWHGAVFWGIALIVAGIALFNRREAIEEPPSQAALVEPAALVAPATGETAPVEPATVFAPVRRTRSSLGWITIGAALVALGVAALLDVGGAVHVRLVQFLAVPLAVLGIGLLAGAWWGRARWLVVPALVLTPFVIAASFVHVPFEGGSGNVTFLPTSAAQIRPEYHLVAGQMVIDLRSTKLGSAPVTIHATAVAGHVLVYVPQGASVNVRGRAGGGEVKLFGHTYDGFDVDVQRSFAPASATSPTVDLDLEAAFGQVEVEA